MAQHDMVIENGTGRDVRLDINDAFAALVSNNSGTTEPADTFPFMFWYDSTDGILKLRNSADSAWIELFFIDGSGIVSLGADATELLQIDGTGGYPVIKLLGTDGIFVPSGTTAQRPSGTPTAMIRHNTNTNKFEGYSNGAWNALGEFNGYAAVVGSEAYCSHANLTAALADSAVTAGSKILVVTGETVNTTGISISKANLQIEFMPGITFTAGTSAKALIIGAAGVRIKGGRFSGFTTAIEITDTFNFNFVKECRFASCTTDIDDLNTTPNNVFSDNITE